MFPRELRFMDGIITAGILFFKLGNDIILVCLMLELLLNLLE